MNAAGRPSEVELIRRYLAPLAGDAGALGLRDDCALLSPRSGEDLVLTNDAVAAGVHFFADDPPASIARKALRVNLSDLAAKGARPVGYLMALGLPSGWTEDWIADFAGGLGEDQTRYGIQLLGGDTIAAGDRLVISITAIGAVPAGTMVRRGGARPGDRILVTGTIGDAALGLKLRHGARPGTDAAFLLDRYLHPQPRTGIADALRTFAHGAMDVSDGLVGDLGKMAEAAGVAITIDSSEVPLSPATRSMIESDPRNLLVALTGGDDYEIVAAVPPDAVARFRQAAGAAGVVLSDIGAVTSGTGLTVLGPDGARLGFDTPAFDHFS